jgi:hypothetical protein
MTAITGAVNLTGMIAPTDTTDVYPTHSSEYGLGGFKEVANQTARDAITAQRRVHGMLVFQQSDGKFYQLGTGLANADWTEVSLPVDTDSLVEGSTNLYYTQARFDIAFTAKSTTDLTEGTNLYYTQSRFDTAFTAKSTTDLTEGTNLYFTNARAISAIGNYVATISGTANEIEVTGSGSSAASVTIGLPANVTVSNDLLVQGDLTVNGTTTTVLSQNTQIQENILYLNEGGDATITNAVGNGSTVTYTADNNFSLGFTVDVTGVTPSSFDVTNAAITAVTATTFTISSTVTDTYVSGGDAEAHAHVNVDLGWAGSYDDGTYAHAGLFRDATDGVFKIFEGYIPEPKDAVDIDTSHASFSLADFNAENVLLNSAPTNANHATTKSYVDSAVSSVSTTVGNLDTDDIAEGLVNLYYTDARADARVDLQTGANLDLSQKSTTDLAEGTNLYYTDARVQTVIDTNTAGFITASSTDTLTNKSGNISQWTNDAGYLTSETDSQTLSFTSPNLTISNGNTVDLSALLDDTDTNTYLSSMTFNTSDGVLTATLNDSSTVTVDLDGRYLTSYTDTNDIDYINSASFNTGDGVLTLSGVGNAGATVDLDGRYLTSYSETDTLATVTARGSTSANDITISKAGAPVLTVETSATSGQDALIKIGGARTSSSTSDIAMIAFRNETTSAYTLAQISAMDPSGAHANGNGRLVFRTSNGGTLSDTLIIPNTGKLTYSGDNVATETWVGSQGYITSLSGYATETYVNTQVANLVDSAPSTLDTLNELAAALGDDPNFATTISTDIGNRVRKDGVDNGSIDIVVNDADFIVRDTTDSITNFIWRDHSLNELKLGTANAVPTLRAAMNANSNNINNIATAGMTNGYASAKFAVASTSVHASYDLYNNGTTYFNGQTNVDDWLYITNGNLDIGSGAIRAGNNGREGVYFENDKHGITFNDGQGNFNIRVGNNGLANEACTEAGYIFQDEWSQSGGWREFNVSTASLAVGDLPTWKTAIKYYNTGNVEIGGTLTASGDVCAYGTISDRRQKENVLLIDNALDKVNALSGYTFNYIGDPKEERMTGVMAQEVQEVLPEAVFETNHSVNEQGETESILAVRHGNMVGLLIEAIKEQSQQIAELKQEIEQLKNKV